MLQHLELLISLLLGTKDDLGFLAGFAGLGGDGVGIAALVPGDSNDDSSAIGDTGVGGLGTDNGARLAACRAEHLLGSPCKVDVANP